MFHRVVSAIEKVATDLDGSAIQPDHKQKTVSKVKQKARAFLQEMVANVSPAFIRYIDLKSFIRYFLSLLGNILKRTLHPEVFFILLIPTLPKSSLCFCSG